MIVIANEDEKHDSFTLLSGSYREFLSWEPGDGSTFRASGRNGSSPVEYTSERTDRAFSPGLQHEPTAVNGEYCLPQNFLVGFVKTRGHFGHCWGSGGPATALSSVSQLKKDLD